MSKHYVLFAAPNHSDEFEVAGIFTKRTDAEAFNAELEKSGEWRGCAPPEHLEMRVILDLVGKDRMRQLAEPIARLAAAMPPNT